jgi:hypothetical protein
MWFGSPVETQLADGVAAQHRVAAKRRAKEAATRRGEERIKREAEEATRREAEGPMAPGSWGKWGVGAGWRVKPAAEQSWKRTSDPSVSGWD